MTKSNVEYSRIKYLLPCHKCEGTGYSIGPGIKRKEAIKNPCKICKGTGNWIEDNFHMIVTMPEGNKIAFQVEVGK